MKEWKAQEGPVETAILANMQPDQEYTAPLLAEICNTSHQKVSAVLGSISQGGGSSEIQKGRR